MEKTGYSGFFICYFKKGFDLPLIDHNRLECGFDLVGEVEKLFFDFEGYRDDNDDYYFFKEAYPLSTYFISPVPLSDVLNAPYFQSNFSIWDTTIPVFDSYLDEGNCLETKTILARNNTRSDGLGVSQNSECLQSIIKIFELSQKRASENEGVLVAILNRASLDSYLKSKQMRIELEKLWEPQDPFGELRRNRGYVFADFVLE